MFALISTEELEDLNQICVKQLKNRYNDPTMNKRFILGIDRAKMRLYDVEQEAQKDLVDLDKTMQLYLTTLHLLERLANMRNFRTSRSKVKYYHDINVETKKWEVIELPSRRIITIHNFEEDAEKQAVVLNKNKPFGDFGFPNFLTHK